MSSIPDLKIVPWKEEECVSDAEILPNSDNEVWKHKATPEGGFGGYDTVKSCPISVAVLTQGFRPLAYRLPN